jgi:TPR repeat protein
VVSLNVGGSIFYTLRSTLVQPQFKNSFLGAMFGGRYKTARDVNGHYFIDRNPKFFALILDFLRDPTSSHPQIPTDPKEKEALFQEVEYFGLMEYMFPEEKARELCEQGYAFSKGSGVEKDLKKAVDLLSRAAELGDAKAQNRLAMCYYNGEGVEVNYEKAVDLYTKAAGQGLAWAQYNLALCYKNGYGVPANEEMAKQYFTRAAEQGHAKAKQKLRLYGM